jgi:hypothetical protein
LFHPVDDRLGFVGVDEKACALRAQIIGVGIAAHVPARKREVATLDADLRGRGQIVCGREAPVVFHRDHRVVARVIVAVADE